MWKIVFFRLLEYFVCQVMSQKKKTHGHSKVLQVPMCFPLVSRIWLSVATLALDDWQYLGVTVYEQLACCHIHTTVNDSTSASFLLATTDSSITHRWPWPPNVTWLFSRLPAHTSRQTLYKSLPGFISTSPHVLIVWILCIKDNSKHLRLIFFFMTTFFLFSFSALGRSPAKVTLYRMWKPICLCSVSIYDVIMMVRTTVVQNLICWQWTITSN